MRRASVRDGGRAVRASSLAGRSIDSSAKSAASTKHVVIVDAGFAGLNCAKLASDSSLRITLIDQNNYQQFQPLLYQVATGILSSENAAFNLRDMFFHHENVDAKMSEASDSGAPAMESLSIGCARGLER